MGKTVDMSKNQDAIEVNIEKFPYLRRLKTELTKSENYLQLYEEKKTFLTHQVEQLAKGRRNLEVIQAEIDAMENDIKISRLQGKIYEKKAIISAYHKEVSEVYPDMLENYERICKEALIKVKDKTIFNWAELKLEIETGNTNSSEFKINWEKKMRHFIELKRLLSAKPEAEKND